MDEDEWAELPAIVEEGLADYVSFQRDWEWEGTRQIRQRYERAFQEALSALEGKLSMSLGWRFDIPTRPARDIRPVDGHTR